MRKIRFEVPGRPVGYMTTTVKSKWNPRYQKYADYCKLVRLCARAAGIRLPLVATKEKPLMVNTIAYYPDNKIVDPENVRKGVCDSLFFDEYGELGKRSKKGDDRWCGGHFPPPKFSKTNPRVIVIIKRYVPKKGKKS